MKKTATLVAALFVLLLFGTACEPWEVQAFQNVLASREEIKLNGFLTCVRHHESDRGAYPYDDGYHIGNGHGDSTSAGAYQFVGPTWRHVSARAGYPGWSTADKAPPHVQDAVAYDTAITRGEKYHWKGTGC